MYTFFKPIIILFFIIPNILWPQKYIIDNFESDQTLNNWHFQSSENADSTFSYIQINTDSLTVMDGQHSLRLDWSVDVCENWGGLSRIEQWMPEDSLLNLSYYDTLSLWYNVTDGQSENSKSEFHFILFDGSAYGDSYIPASADSCEVYYSIHHILDHSQGWNELKIPLEQAMEIGEERFVRTGWHGISGNEQLDTDKIKGFAFEFARLTTSDSAHLRGTISLDSMTVFTKRDRQDIIFNGSSLSADVTMSYKGTDGSIELSDQIFYSFPRSIKWTTSQHNVNTGPVFTFANTLDYSFHWQKNPMSFNIRPDTGTGDLILVISDNDIDANGSDQPFEARYIIDKSRFKSDGSWQEFSIPLQDFDRFAGFEAESGEMDSTHIWQVSFMIGDSACLGRDIYLDNIVLGMPIFKKITRQPEFAIIPDTAAYQNIVVWTDVQEEEDETYNVYCSSIPITPSNYRTDIVDQVAFGLLPDIQVYEHLLIAPLHDKMITNYYAVTCTDQIGIESEPMVSQTVTGKAKGSAVINFTSDFEFKADGNLNEWQIFYPFRLRPSDGSGTVVEGTLIDDDEDLSGLFWLACDNDYLYLAGEVIDDTVFFEHENWPLWQSDSPDLYIGLYDKHGIPHQDLTRGAEPDYHFGFAAEGVFDYLADSLIVTVSTDYLMDKTADHKYVIEARIPFARLATIHGDSIFVPIHSHALPIDISINDADISGQREGILTFSPNNQDESWRDIWRWLHTFIWDISTGIANEKIIKPAQILLKQNYPNPFNPETVISWQLATSCHVDLSVYNLLGEKVSTLISQRMNPGKHNITFAGNNLANGIYFYQLVAGEHREVRKMIILR